MSHAPDRAAVSRELLSDWVGRWAKDRPDVQALSYREERWTWTQWHDRVRRATGLLSAAGVRRGDRIAFLDKNNPVCLELTFAAAALGATIAIANWRLAGDELAYVLRDSGATILFAGSGFVTSIDAIDMRAAGIKQIIAIGGDADAYEQLLGESAAVGPSNHVSPEDAALLVYSSGTTGRPKGVLLSQRALVAHVANVATRIPMGDGDKNLVAMPLFHVGGICYAFQGIRAGVPSIMTREPDLSSLVDALQDGATHAFFVPPIIASFLDAGESAITTLSHLRSLAYGAAPMPLPLLRRALSAWPGVDFIQVYGQTELSGVVTILDPADHRDPARPHLLRSAGTAIAGTEIQITDVGTGTQLPPGQQGEIRVRTQQAMTEYLNQPKATADTIAHGGWVRTGDVGHLDAEGFLFIDDRLKDLIITGGENVYGLEVERVLLDHPEIVDAAVIGVPDEHWGESVKAVIVATRELSAEDVIAFCRERLAGYKCPRTVDMVTELPRNPTGKLLKRELRQPFWSGHDRTV